MAQSRLWGRVIRDHRIISNETVPIEDGDFDTALRELCRRFDLQRPLQFPKNDRDLASFGRTFYTKEHFTESISFQRLEVEILAPEGEKRGSVCRSPLTDA
ncbi:MAG: hypothetical protein K5746_00210 [Clostridiales bacterium]|nr:hypothetical protein [Clostridiales bacterium]